MKDLCKKCQISRKAVNIVWDYDEEDAGSFPGLPGEVYIPDDIDDDEAADWLSDKYGWCVYSFEIKKSVDCPHWDDVVGICERTSVLFG